jgi:hypothetical protein
LKFKNLNGIELNKNNSNDENYSNNNNTNNNNNINNNSINDGYDNNGIINNNDNISNDKNSNKNNIHFAFVKTKGQFLPKIMVYSPTFPCYAYLTSESKGLGSTDEMKSRFNLKRKSLKK